MEKETVMRGEKDDIDHNEFASGDNSDVEVVTAQPSLNFVEDPERSKRLRLKVDLRFLPLCAFIYLLNYLDRGNIGAAKIMNEETKDDILDATGTTTYGYSTAVSLFSLAYATFEIPSNWIMKRFVRPSLWLGFLLFGWGALTLGFTGVQTYPQIVVLRFFIGVFEAGFYPGILCQTRTLRVKADV